MQKHRTRKRSRAVLVGLGLATVSALSLSACGSGGSLPTGDGDGDVTKLVIATNESPWLNAYKAVVAEYQEESGVQVELRSFPPDELRTQQINDIQAGTHSYDVFQMDEPNVQEFMENEWLQPLTDIDSSFTPDAATNDYDNLAYWDPETKTSNPDGDLMVQPINGNVGLFMYRTDLYDELGLKAPVSWDDVLANGKAAMESGKVKYGYVIRTQDSGSASAAVTFDFLPLLYSFGANWFVDEGTDWTPAVNSPEAIAAATMLRELAKLGPAETTTMGQAQVIGAMQAGDALQTNLVAAAGAQLESESDSNVAGKIGYSVLPVGPTGEHGVQEGTQTLGIPAGLDKDRSAAALEFIKWFESKQSQVTFTENGGIPTRDDVIGDPGVDTSGKGYLEAVQDSSEYLRKHVRYPFVATMLPVTEKWLGQIASGAVTPEDGMNGMQTDLVKVIEDAGYPMASGK